MNSYFLIIKSFKVLAMIKIITYFKSKKHRQAVQI